MTKAFYIRFLNFWDFINISIKRGYLWINNTMAKQIECHFNSLCSFISPFSLFFTLSLLFILHKHSLQKCELTEVVCGNRDEVWHQLQATRTNEKEIWEHNSEKREFKKEYAVDIVVSSINILYRSDKVECQKHA